MPGSRARTPASPIQLEQRSRSLAQLRTAARVRVNRTDEKADAGLKAAGGLIGRGWVRTSDLSRVKGDEGPDKSQETPGKRQDPGDGG